MNASPKNAPVLILRGMSAADLMTPSAPSIRENAPIPDAIALFADRGVGAAAVIDPAGRPIGVVSRTDVLIHEREQTGRGAAAGGPTGARDRARVGDVMTPAVFAVAPDYPADKVVADLLRLKVHQLFVVDAAGVLIGVVNAQDVLRHLRPETPGATRERTV
jgi:CBS domain-containing protein